MRWDWLCKIGLHKWIVVDQDASSTKYYCDKVCILDGCSAVVCDATTHRNKVIRNRQLYLENQSKARLKWKQLTG